MEVSRLAAAALNRPQFRSQRTAHITESVIREMTRVAARSGAVNLAQGFPDFAAPDVLKQAAADAIFGDINQYAITWGAKPFRDAIAAKYSRTYGLSSTPSARSPSVRLYRGNDGVADGACRIQAKKSSSSSPTTRTTARHAARRRVPPLRQAAAARLVL